MIDRTGANAGTDGNCRASCASVPDCAFYSFHSSGWCIRFRTCDTWQTASTSGYSTYVRNTVAAIPNKNFPAVTTKATTTATTTTAETPCAESLAVQQAQSLAALEKTAQAVAASMQDMLQAMGAAGVETAALEREEAALDEAIKAQGC